MKLQPRKLSWWLRRVGNVGAFFFAGVLLIVVLGLAQRIGWLSSGMGSGNSTSAGSGQQIYTCPMHPQIRQEGEGRCPICGMALVPAATASSGGDDFAIQIEPAQRRVANIQTAPVVSHPVISTIRTIGSIRIDESRKATIASYVDGRIERLFADYTGVFVEPNDHLAVIYSPQLYAAQVEYLEAIESQSKLVGSALQSVRETQDKLVRNARQRLIELGLSEQQLLDLEKNKEAKSRLTIYAPIGGTVIEKLAEEGMYTKAGEPIYRVANLSTVWLMLELYPADAAKIRFGQVVKAELNSMPGKTLQGRVAFVDPEVDPSNRTVGVRVEFKNANGELRPGDYAEATIEIPIGPKGDVYDAELADKWISPMHPQIIQDQPGTCPICGMELVPTSRYGYSSDPVEQTESLTIPRTALLMAGEYSVVYVETEPGRFEIRSVKVGPILKDEVVIVDGLKVSESVATSGNFLIDSQMQLAGKPSLIDPTRAIKKQSIRNTPLQFDDINVSVVNGETGAKLEELFQAYFGIQQAFAADKRPTENQVKQYQDVANALLQADQLDDDVLNLIESTLDPVAHLHHHKIDEARQKFKPISHAVVRLATIARGESAKQPFHQFFCPMVKQGEGDWLQDNDLLSNPYWGSEMLRCGELVRTISPDQQTLVDDTPAQGDQ
ncbi:efflux RND transporter periplasmic adaptor subunit [Stieleria sp. JC731]|uniref:efflux RND transporter periplasmic adaptor subunit n=1 Tax=Stieleria sp. JC731 TaxID=2894195 RepID=UPI001E2E2D2B|nr:efflux RND transporter periplasmic adaptor subunit [Stieleria sp. JC731]MCC9602507.1 efflux RND transporter periplasmic adaptor subunit [Stieleria sp. JC731]